MSDHETSPETPAAATPAAEPTPTREEPVVEEPRSAGKDPLRGSRTSGLWMGLVLISVVLILLIVFIAQNTDPVLIRFLGWEGDAPLAVALLAATVAGLILATVAGSLRILQLRRRVKRQGR
jgi:uncharacterized integral membrane protein